MKREIQTDNAGKAPAHIKSCESLTQAKKKKNGEKTAWHTFSMNYKTIDMSV